MAKKRQEILLSTIGGRPINVDSDVPENATLVHEIVNAEDDMDEIFLYACNKENAPSVLTILHQTFDGEGELESSIEISKINLPALSGLYNVVSGIPFRNPIQGKTAKITAISSVPSAINLTGWFNVVDFGVQNRITSTYKQS